MCGRPGAGASTGSRPPGRQRIPSDHPGGGSVPASARGALDRVLELVERRQLSATELRVLLRLLDQEATLPKLADALAQRPVEIRRAGRRLAMRGLVQWRHVGRRAQTRLALTAAGMATMRALLTAASQTAAEPKTPEAAVR